MIRRLLCIQVTVALALSSHTQDIEEDVTSEEADLWDSFMGLFADRKVVRIVRSRDRGAAGYELLDHFCLDESLWYNDTVVSCDCCTDHLIGDEKAQAALLYNSGKVQAPAFVRQVDGIVNQVGMVNAWSLGGRVPAVLCDRGRLVCHCEDPRKNWAEFELACKRGADCTPEDSPAEGVSEGYTGNDEDDETDSEEEGTEGDDEGEESNTAEDEDGESSEGAGADDGESADSSSSAAASLMQGGGGSSGPDDDEDVMKRCAANSRIPLGSAFCEDFVVGQCDHAYARTKLGRHHLCEIDAKMFRHCGGTLLREPEAQEKTNEAQSWGIQNFYTPDMPWKVETKDFDTHVVEDPLPDPDVFEEFVDKRMQAQGTAELLLD